MAKLANVAQINPVEDKNVFMTIHTFLERKGQNSINTKKTYERHIRDFFVTMRNKKLEELVEQDIIFTAEQIEAYQVRLKDNHKGSTVNGVMSALKECYKKLEKKFDTVSSSWFDVERFDEHDSEKYDTLSHEEIIQIIDLVSKTRKGSEKALLVRVAYATAFRRTSLQELKWDDIVEINEIKYLRVLGKGNKWSYKKISDNLYSALMEHKELTKRDKIFSLTKKTIQKMMNYVNDNMDFGHRKIVFHSIKKASLNEVNLLSGGNIKLIQAHGDHSNASTPLNHYIADKQKEELLIIDTDYHVPVEEFDNLNRKELVDLVKSMDRTTQIKLLKKMGVI